MVEQLLPNSQDQEWFRLVVEASPNAIIMVDHQGRIVLVNRQAENLFGYARSELLGQLIEILLPQRYRAAHPGHRSNFFSKPVTRPMGAGRDLYGSRKDGSEIPIEIGLNPIHTTSGTFVLASIIDITERKRAQQKLEKQKSDLEKVNLELDSFVYTASHDLRAPLRIISSFASFLEDDYRDKLDEQGKEYLNEIRKGVNRMGRLIEDLLSLSRITRINNPYEEVDMNELIGSVLDRIEFDLKEHGVRLVISPDLPTVYCDRVKVAEVWLNLINNAVKFSRGQGSSPVIEIGYEDRPAEYEFYVKDNGIGFDAKHAERIFGIFKRLHTHKEYEGSGIGLSIVKRVIDDHRGRIWALSQPGQGATFYFTISKELKAPAR